MCSPVLQEHPRCAESLWLGPTAAIGSFTKEMPWIQHTAWPALSSRWNHSLCSHTSLVISNPQNCIFAPHHATWSGDKSPQLCIWASLTHGQPADKTTLKHKIFHPHKAACKGEWRFSFLSLSVLNKQPILPGTWTVLPAWAASPHTLFHYTGM